MGLRRASRLVTETESHFTRTLQGGYESDMPWKSIRWLQGHRNRLVFGRALSWLSSDDPLKRARAAAVLGQLRTSAWRPDRGPRYDFFRLYRQESFNAIVAALQEESDARTISSFVSALGHLDVEEAVPVVASFEEHESANVRFSVSWALGCYPRDKLSMEVLERLMDDVDRDVRDWAIFGVGVQGDADSSQLRDSFVRHLDDSFLDARMEAAAALGKRRDARVVEPLIRMLRTYGALNGLTEAAKSVLELDDDPPSWFGKEYIAALEDRFPGAL